MSQQPQSWCEMHRQWMSVGRDYWSSGALCNDDGELIAKQLIERAIDGLEWIDATKEQTLPALPGMSIEGVIKELRIPRVTLISHCCRELAPYGFYGIEGNYKNGRVRLYVVDSGTHCTPVCADHWPDNGEALAVAKGVLDACA